MCLPLQSWCNFCRETVFLRLYSFLFPFHILIKHHLIDYRLSLLVNIFLNVLIVYFSRHSLSWLTFVWRNLPRLRVTAQHTILLTNLHFFPISLVLKTRTRLDVAQGFEVKELIVFQLFFLMTCRNLFQNNFIHLLHWTLFQRRPTVLFLLW